MSSENGVEAALLPAKLSRPRLDGIYPRRRVFKAIDEGKHYPAIWVSGPAGSGKTTVVNSYLNDHNINCLWYTVDEGDSDIASFFYYLRKWASHVCPAETDLPPLMTPENFSNISLFAKRFFEKLYALFPSSLALVFDDYQEAGNFSPLHVVIDNAVSQLPAHIRIYILSREEPPPEMARQRANCQLYLLGWKHLRLELNETRNIAHTVAMLETTDEIFADLQAKTDGWVAGLILLLKRGEYEGIKPQLLSSQTPQEIFEYLGGELFEKQSSEIQEHLLQLSFLPRISINAAKAVTAEQDVDIFLQRLYQGNTFLNRLVGEKIYYRFHPLMQAFLKMKARRILTREKLKALQIQSAAILSREGEIEEAVHLYIEAGDLPTAIYMIAVQAPELAGQGRFMTLEKMIAILPDPVQNNEPWIIYWRAACKLPYAVMTGGDSLQNELLRKLFVQALERFEQENDQKGSYLALAGILEAIWMEMNEFSELDPWIAKYEALREKWGPDHPPEVMQWLTPAISSAFLYRQPDHKLFPEFIKKGMQILENNPEPAAAIRLFQPITLLHIFQGNLTAAEYLFSLCRWCADENISIVGTSIYYTLSSYYCWLRGLFYESKRLIELAVRIEKKHEIRIMSQFLYSFGAISALSVEDFSDAEDYMLQHETLIHNCDNFGRDLYSGAAGWMALVKKDVHGAKIFAIEGLNFCKHGGCPLSSPQTHLQVALTLHLAGEPETAKAYLKTALAFSQQYHTLQVEFGCHLARAEFALAEENQSELNRALEDAFKIGSEQDYIVTWFWRQDVMAELCVQALERNIETDYVKSLIRRRKLIPETPPYHLENWPWQIKINTLGRFSLEIDGEPVTFTGKAQLKPLSLLKYLIANGGQDISDIRLQDDLWPDSDGDRAAKALKAALHRLRKMLGDNQSVLVSARQISLNNWLCWTDVRAFEDLCKKTESLLEISTPDAQKKLPEALDHLSALYKGQFLPDEDAHWAIHTRKRLASRFSKLVKRLSNSTPDIIDIETTAV